MTPLPLADRYSRFKEFVFSGLEESPSLLPGLDIPLSELDLQSLWFAGAFGREFVTPDGQAVKVVDFGVWNSGAGPDFAECVIEHDGRTRRGAIELDPDARDWERHAHGSNPDYAGVILHLFLNSPVERFFTRNFRHEEIPQVRLSLSQLEASARPIPGQAAARLGRCGIPLRTMDDARVQSLLESAAQYRLERKSRRLHRSIEAQGAPKPSIRRWPRPWVTVKTSRPFCCSASGFP